MEKRKEESKRPGGEKRVRRVILHRSDLPSLPSPQPLFLLTVAYSRVVPHARDKFHILRARPTQSRPVCMMEGSMDRFEGVGQDMTSGATGPV